MAIITVTSTADSGTGTLREALLVAANGDTIRFADSLEVDGVITITVNSALDAPAVNVTIDGEGHWTESGELKTRVVLNATAGVGDEFKVIRGNSSNSCVCNLTDLTLQNGYVPSGTSFGAGLQIRTNTYDLTNVINYCVFKNCEGGAYGGGVSLYAGVAEFNNCVFDGNKATNGAAVLTYQSAQATLNNCRVVNNNNTSVSSGCVYLMSTSRVNLSNCVFSGNTGRDLSDNSIRSTESLIATETNTLTGAVYISSSSIASFSGSFTCGSLSAISGAVITFNGVDSVLAVTNTATIGSATFTASANSMGYAAFPSETDTSAATFTGVKLATYSTSTPTISATITNRDASIDIKNAGSGYITEVEYADGTVDDLTITEGAAEIAVDKAFKIRLFNGAFYYSPFVPRTYYLKTYDVDGDFATAADWTLDAQKTLTCNTAPTIQNGTFYCTAPEV